MNQEQRIEQIEKSVADLEKQVAAATTTKQEIYELSSYGTCSIDNGEEGTNINGPALVIVLKNN